MNSTILSLIVPGLIDPVPYLKELPAQDLPELPVFSSFLSRGKHITPDIYDHSNNNLYTCLLKQFSMQNSFAQPPIASFSYLFDIKNITESEAQFKEALKGKYIMRVDPCFMVPDRDQLILAKTGNLELSLQEAKQLVKEINQFFEQFDDDNFWTLTVISPERWYLISDKPFNIETVPPEKALGQPLKSYLFSANTEDKKYWLNLFNEFQMILHQSSVNQYRKENNKVPVNSVWFWGDGDSFELLNVLSQKESLTDELVVYSDNSVVQGMTHAAQGASNSFPDAYLSEPNNTGRHSVYVIDDFSRAIQNKDIFSWVGLLQQFEKNYLLPIFNDINSGKISQLELVSPTGSKLMVTKKLLRRWWRRNKKFNLFFSGNFC